MPRFVSTKKLNPTILNLSIKN
uniref:Uncharacterized protein n=1 Tax=Arundo donax TaxID=35708 RepID=A0A0A9F8T0_ARUDO